VRRAEIEAIAPVGKVAGIAIRGGERTGREGGRDREPRGEREGRDATGGRDDRSRGAGRRREEDVERTAQGSPPQGAETEPRQIQPVAGMEPAGEDSLRRPASPARPAWWHGTRPGSGEGGVMTMPPTDSVAEGDEGHSAGESMEMPRPSACRTRVNPACGCRRLRLSPEARC